MDQNQWILDLESKVLSLVKGKTITKLKKKYPQITYTITNISNDSKAGFPCVYIHQLGSSESNRDLENIRVNTITAGFQIEVYSNTSQIDCKAVMSQVINCMKGLMFNIKLTPYADNQAPVYRYIARVERTFDWNDVF